MTDDPLSDFEVTDSDIGDAEADARERDNDLLRAVLTGLAIFALLRLRWEYNGRPIDNSDLIEALGTEERQRLNDLYAAFASGQIDVARWLVDTATSLRRFHIQAAALGRGGFDAITDVDISRLSSFLEQEFGYLRGFADEIANLSEAQSLDRLRKYSNHGQTTFWEARRETCNEIGLTEERSVLHPADHCGPCMDNAALDWQPIGTIVAAPGTICDGGPECKCGMEFR